jgi:hypothetical protein
MDSIKTYDIENAQEIEEMLKTRNFAPSWTRLNVVENPEIRYMCNGRKALVEPVLSEVKKKGPLFRAVTKHQQWIQQITLNKNLKCARHVDRNKGVSYFAMFGDFTGGGLFVETPEGVNHLTEKRVWYEFDGQHPHWTEDFTGDRYSIVAYRKN